MSYADVARDVDAGLAEAGQRVTIRRYSPTRNTITGVSTKGAATLTASAAAVEVPVTQTLRDSFAAVCEPGALVNKKVRAFKVSPALGFEPQAQDEITLADSTVWPVVGCTAMRPDGTPLLYTVGIAK